MTATGRPWTRLYPPHVNPVLEEHPLRADTLRDAWAQRVKKEPQSRAIGYFDLDLSASRVDELTDGLAAFFQRHGVEKDERVGVQLQNVPQFALCLIALWKLGAVPLILNPMYGPHELTTILSDAQPVGIISSETGKEDIDRLDIGETRMPWVLQTNDQDLAALNAEDSGVGAEGPAGLVQSFVPHIGSSPSPVELSGDDPALLTYTSGTTGPPKGAVGSHANLLAVGYGVQQWLDVRPGESVLAVAPLFHITGAVATAAMTLTVGRAVLVFIGRLRPEAMLAALPDVQHILGSITVYNALLDLEGLTREHLAGLKTVYSGGAPVPPATVTKFEDRFGHYIHNVYGMTETASAVIGVPLGERAPVDQTSGTLAIGVPLPAMDARVVDSTGADAETGTMGELVLKGPQCISKYLNKPEATANTIREGWLHTGDVALMDAQGWIYLVDRQKDQINVSGYKVWPREVEDVVYEHPAVREVAVVGLPDKYSGERVVVFASAQAGQTLQPNEIQELVRGRLAAFKAPKEVVIIDDLPKTPTGKIQRRVLRDRNRLTTSNT